MMNKLLATDKYLVINKTITNNNDRNILNMLYLPIIGPYPIMLYYSLWSDLDKLEIISKEYTHHHLLLGMQIPLDEVLKAREALEGIGLIKTYIKHGEINNYIYEIFSPLSAYDFLNHPILNVSLYNIVGKNEYDDITEYFKMPKINKVGYEDITKSFNEVYQSIPYQKLDIENENIRKFNKQKLNINTSFDISFLKSLIEYNIEEKKIFTKENQELFMNLSFLYDLDAIKLASIIPSCLTDKGYLSKDELRKMCRNYYQFDHDGSLPIALSRNQPDYLKSTIEDSSKRSKMIYTFENISIEEFLKSKNGGNEPTKRDMRLAENLVIDYGLKPGVVNVLFDYVLKTNNNKLTTSLVETIAGQWSRLNILTVVDAMTLAEKEYKKYKNKKHETTNPKKIEKVPDWFDKKIDKTDVSDVEKNEIEEMLKEYKQ